MGLEVSVMKHGSWIPGMISLVAAFTPACTAVGDATDTVTRDLSEEPVGAAVSEYSVSGFRWQMGYRGGTGGGPYSISCGSGAVAVGITGRSGAYVDQLGLACATLQNDGSLGPMWTTGNARRIRS
jgi:hypothetical protein